MMTFQLLDKLPHEIVQQIFQSLHKFANLAPDGKLTLQYYEFKRRLIDTNTLYALCLTSTRCRDIARPVLYRNFVQADSDASFYMLPRDGWRRTLELFLRTVTESSHLARLVRTATFTESFIHGINMCPTTIDTILAAATDLSPNFISDVERIVQDEKGSEFSLSECVQTAKSWDVPGYQDSHDIFVAGSAFIGILIALMPNLTSLALPQLPRTATELYLPVLDALGASFDSLKSFTGRMEFHKLAPLIKRMPGLMELNICDVSCPRHEDEASLMERGFRLPRLPTMAKVKTLRFEGASIGEPWMKVVLSRCSRLEKFVYAQRRENAELVRGIVPWSRAADVAMGALWSEAQMVKVLETHKETLRSVHIDLREHGDHRSVVPDLKSFDHIEELFLSIPQWTNWPDIGLGKPALREILPSSIRYLCVVCEAMEGRERFVSELYQMADAQLFEEKPFPKLQIVEYGMRKPEQWFDTLKRVFRRAGVWLVATPPNKLIMGRPHTMDPVVYDGVEFPPGPVTLTDGFR